MKTILTIGYNSIALPDKVNVGAIIEALRKGVRVQRGYKHASHDEYFVEGDGLVEITITQIANHKLHPSPSAPAPSEDSSPDQPVNPRTLKRINGTPELRLLSNG